MSPSTFAVPDKGRKRGWRQRSARCKGQERRPAQHKRSSARRPLCRSSGTGLASDRASDTSMPSTTSPQPGSKLWVCPSFGTFSDMQAAPAVRPLSRRGTAHQCGVNGQQKQAIRNDFYASLVLADRDNIEITHQGVHRESSARLPAYSGRRPLNWAPTRAQHTRPWARGKVISEGIMRLATPHLAAVRRSRRNRRARNSGGSRLSSGEVGRAVKTRAAYGPASRAGRRRRHRVLASTAWDAARCQPRVLSSCGSPWTSGRGSSPWSASCQQDGGSKLPATFCPPSARFLLPSPGQVERRKGGRV